LHCPIFSFIIDEMAERTRKKQNTTKPEALKKPVKAAKAKKATKTTKVPTKSSTASTTKVEKSPVVESPTTATPNRAVRIKKSYFFTVLGILLLVALIYLLRNLVVAASVNGQYISRLTVINELERQGGKQALDSLITKSLITQEAQKRKITIAQSEVDGELKKIDANLAKQGQKLDQVLQLQGMTKEQLVEQIKLQKMIEKMVGKITVSDKEIDDYLTTNKESLPQDQDERTLRTNVQNQLQQQKLNEKAQKFLEDIRAKAKINRFVSY
jgi:hypothetical protein